MSPDSRAPAPLNLTPTLAYAALHSNLIYTLVVTVIPSFTLNLTRTLTIHLTVTLIQQAELKKYDALKADIRANVERQAELLAVLQQQQQAFRSAFGFADWRRACEVLVPIYTLTQASSAHKVSAQDLTQARPSQQSRFVSRKY